MAIRFRCPSCGQELSVKEELAGKQGRCPKCKNPMAIPGAGGIASAPPPPPPPVPARAKGPASDFAFDDNLAPLEEPAGRRRREPEPAAGPVGRLPSKVSLALLFHSLAAWIYVGAIGLSCISLIVYAGMIQAKESKDKKRREAFKDGKRPSEAEMERMRKEAEAEQKEREARAKKAKHIREWLGEESKLKGPDDVDSSFFRAVIGAGVWIESASVFQTIIGFLVGFAILAALVLSVIGASFMVASFRNGLELGFSIATLSATGICVGCMIFVLIKCFIGDGGFCTFLPFTQFNFLAGVPKGVGIVILGTWLVGAIGFVMYLVPILEMGRAATMALYVMFLGSTQRVRSVKIKGLILCIVVPSALLLGALLVVIPGAAMKSYKDLMSSGREDGPSIWPPAIILFFYGALIAAAFVWSAVSISGSRRALLRQRPA